MPETLPGAPSVVTLASGREDHLRALISGLERSSIGPAELVVVRMNGWRPERDLAATSFPLRFLDVAGAGGGLPLAAARNAGARGARSCNLVFLDADCIPSPTLLGSYREALDAFDGLLMGEVRYLPPGAGDRFLEDGGFPALFAAGASHPARERPPRAGVRWTPRYETFWSLSFAVRRGTFFGGVGGFDEGYAGYGAEDTDFAFRARRAGVPLASVGGAAAFHQHHETCDPPLQHLESIVRNARRFRSLWGLWPMEGWLEAFVRLGLVDWDGEDLTLLRPPTEAERGAHRRGVPARAG